jgi:hypothetical protein
MDALGINERKSLKEFFEDIESFKQKINKDCEEENISTEQRSCINALLNLLIEKWVDDNNLLVVREKLDSIKTMYIIMK